MQHWKSWKWPENEAMANMGKPQSEQPTMHSRGSINLKTAEGSWLEGDWSLCDQAYSWEWSASVCLQWKIAIVDLKW